MADTKNQETYREFKEKHPDAIVLLRCGDFYELRGEDAETASRELGLTLSRHTVSQQLYCCFPHFALDTHLPRLIRKGHRVAIIDG